MSTRTATVLPGQALPDIAIEHCGALSAWCDIAVLNGLNLTSTVTPGTVLKVPAVVDPRARRILNEGGWHPAVGTGNILDGIDYMAVSYDFVTT